ncbi:MAG: tetratricopeptide repeat protein [Chloroflexi bacterium]|nr:tetratricopeptide repeat protein [Chloroflexota bacterium]
MDISPLDTQARLHLIDQVTARGDIEEAISQYLELADVFYRLAQLDRARETYETALRLAQSTDLDSTWTAQILHQMADIDLQRFDWRKALRVYEQLRTLVPEDEGARENLVKLNLRLTQEEKANTELDNYLSYLNSRSRDDAAGEFLRELVKELPEYVLGRRRLAEHYQQVGNRDEAINQWNKVGEMLVQAGDREGAKVAVRAVLSLNPPNAERYQQFLQRLNK